MKIKVLFLLVAVSSCASFQERSCNTEGAYQLGRSQAKKWESNNSKLLGAKCAEVSTYSVKSFMKDYTSGYSQQMEVQCSEGEVEATAEAAANAGDYSHKEFSKFTKCSGKKSVKKLKKVYMKAFAEVYCTEAKAFSLAQEASSKLSAMDMNFMNPCPRKSRRRLGRLYKKEYEKGIKQQCSPINVTHLGIQDARSGKQFGEGLNNLKRCPARMQTRALRNYQLAFYREKQRAERLAQQDQVNQDRQRDIIRNSRVDFKAMGRSYYTLCEIAGTSVKSTLYFADDKQAYLTGYFNVQVYDDLSNIIHNQKNIYVSTSYGKTGDKKDIPSFVAPSKAYSCKAFYYKK
ncbi:MAG: hypothetical protein KC493_15650 [Bacteriovoracaceae bacterium]|nr:hypothetical protein [Bacteriovoracaceae bacterium]